MRRGAAAIAPRLVARGWLCSFLVQARLRQGLARRVPFCTRLFSGSAWGKTTHAVPLFQVVGQMAPLRSSRHYPLVPFRREGSILTHLFPLASALCLSVHNILILFILEKHSSFPIRPVGANRLPQAPIAVKPGLAIFYIILFFNIFFSWLGFCSRGGEFSSKGRRPWNVRRGCRHLATEIVKIITISFTFQAG